MEELIEFLIMLSIPWWLWLIIIVIGLTTGAWYLS